MSGMYESFHEVRGLQKKVITKDNFTYRDLIKTIDKLKGIRKILDVGSGVGTVCFYLASRGKDVTGIEISENAIRISRKSAEYMGLSNIRFVKGDFNKKELKTKYDLIICSEVLEHLKNDKKAIDKIGSAVQKAGFIIITVPSTNAPLYKLGLTKKFDNKVGHLRRYNYKDLKVLLTKHKLKVVYRKNREGIIRNSLFIFSFGENIVRLANKSKIVSDLFTFIDDLTIPLFGESNIYLVIKKL